MLRLCPAQVAVAPRRRACRATAQRTVQRRAPRAASCSDGAARQPGDERRRTPGGGSGAAGALGGMQGGAGLIATIWGDRPQTDGPLNYAQMLEYLQNKRVLRLLIYDEGKNAIGALPLAQLRSK